MPVLHAKTFQPSSSKRWLNCSGCLKLVEDIEDTNNPAAMLGSIIHQIGEECLTNGYDASRYKGAFGLYKEDDSCKIVNVVEECIYSVKITQEHIDAVNVYINKVKDIKSKLTGGIYLIEEKLDMSWFVEGLSGTGDFIAIEPLGNLHIVDYKNGYNVVEVENNSQMRIYALGAVGEHNYHGVEQVTMTIVQPNARHFNGPVRSCVISVEELFSWANEELGPKAEKCQEAIKTYGSKNWEEKYLNAGTWCKYCKVESSCPALRKKVFSKVEIMFNKEDIMPVKKEEALPDIKLLPIDKMFKIYKMLPDFRNWANAIEKKCFEHLNINGEAHGYKLIQGYGNRIFKDTVEAKNILMDIIDKEDLYNKPELKSPAQIEKILTKEKFKPQERKEIIEPLVVRPLGKKKIVEVGHDAPAIQSKIKQMFN